MARLILWLILCAQFICKADANIVISHDQDMPLGDLKVIDDLISSFDLNTTLYTYDEKVPYFALLRDLKGKIPDDTDLVVSFSKNCHLLSLTSALAYSIQVPHVMHLDAPLTTGCHIKNSKDARLNLNLLIRKVLGQLAADNVKDLLLLHGESFSSPLSEGLSIGDTMTIHSFSANQLHYQSVNDQIDFIKTISDTVLLLLDPESFGIFEKAKDLLITGPMFNWIILGVDVSVEEVTQHVEFEDNIVFMDTRHYFKRHKSLDALMRNAQKTSAVNHNLIATSLIGFETVCCVVEKCNSPFQSPYSGNCSNDVPLWNLLEDAMSSSSLVDIWHTSHQERRVILSLRGRWNPHESMSTFPGDLAQPFQGLHGKRLLIATVPNLMFQIKLSEGNFTGLVFDVLNELAAAFNFTYDIMEPPDRMWGVLLDDGSWNGMIGMILKKEIDFAVGSFTINAQRESAIDFTLPFFRGDYSMMMKLSSEEDNMFGYIKPFSSKLWYLLVASLVFVTLVLWCITKWSPMCEESQDPVTIGIYLIASLLCKDNPLVPKSYAVRIVLTFVWLAFLILGATYTGKLVASFTVHKKKIPVDTLEELAHQHDYKAGMVQGEAINQLFMSAKKGIYRDVWNVVSRQEDNLVPNGDAGFEKTINEKYVFIDDTKDHVASIGFSDNPARCDMYIAKEKFFKNGFGFPLPTGSPYLKIFNKKISRMVETGLIDQWMLSRYWPRNEGCDQGLRSVGANSISLSNSLGVFLLLVIGLVVATLTLMLESLPRLNLAQNRMNNDLEILS